MSKMDGNLSNPHDKSLTERLEPGEQKAYTFTLYLRGDGATPDEAWTHAVEAFAADPGDVPEDYEIEDEDEE